MRFAIADGGREGVVPPQSPKIGKIYPGRIQAPPSADARTTELSGALQDQLGDTDRLLLCAPQERKLNSSGEMNDGQFGGVTAFGNRLNDPG